MFLGICLLRTGHLQGQFLVLGLLEDTMMKKSRDVLRSGGDEAGLGGGGGLWGVFIPNS